MFRWSPCLLSKRLAKIHPVNKWRNGFSEYSQEAQLPDVVFVTSLKACSSTKELELGRKIHRDVFGTCGSSLYVTNSLVNMYAKCGSVEDASQVFESSQVRDVVTWNGLIKGYVTNGKPELALELFSRIDCAADDLTYVAALTAVASVAADEQATEVKFPPGSRRVKLCSLEKGMEIHSKAAKNGYEMMIFVSSTLIDMYRKCGSMTDARGVFDRMAVYDVVSWNSLILGYAENGESQMALDLFTCMEEQELEPDSRAIVAAAVACGSLAEKEDGEKIDGKLVKVRCLETGRRLHSQARSDGFDKDMFVASSLIDMFAKCGSMEDAQGAFDRVERPDVALWNALVIGYADNGQAKKALDMFESMDTRAPNARTFVAALVACTQLASEEHGREVNSSLSLIKLKYLDKALSLHSQAVASGHEHHMFLSNTLIDLYTKCGSLLDARRVFDRMPEHDVVSWTALTLGYTDHGEDRLALELFSIMKKLCQPNTRTYVAALIACANLVELETGRQLHKDLVELGYHNDTYISNALVDFYGKCSCMEEAKQVFDSVQTKNLVAWSALISGYSCQGSSDQVFELFQRMCDDGIKPDGVCYLSVLTACSHAGLVDKGRQYFDEMVSKHGLQPNIEHYHCLIDMLGRSNQLLEAINSAKSMPFDATVVTWTTVLGACQKWKNVVLGKLAFDSAIRIDNKLLVAYVLMANIYGSVGLREEQAKIQDLRSNMCSS